MRWFRNPVLSHRLGLRTTDEQTRQHRHEPSEDGTLEVGAIRDGASRDGASADGASRDGASRDGASADGASRDGASRDGASADWTNAGRTPVRTFPTPRVPAPSRFRPLDGTAGAGGDAVSRATGRDPRRSWAILGHHANGFHQCARQRRRSRGAAVRAGDARRIGVAARGRITGGGRWRGGTSPLPSLPS